jgi:hypothetical protein
MVDPPSESNRREPLDKGLAGRHLVARENGERTSMAAGSRLMISEAERRYPVRVKLAVPQGGFGRLPEINAWLDENCGADGWAMTPAGFRGVVNDAVAIYFSDAALASAFVARWCAGNKPETLNGLFRVREDEPKRRVPAPHHKTP